MTLDQSLAETIFQLRQTALHGRLIHAKCLRRGQHAAGAREREEMLNIVPIEHPSVCNLAKWSGNFATAATDASALPFRRRRAIGPSALDPWRVACRQIYGKNPRSGPTQGLRRGPPMSQA